MFITTNISYTFPPSFFNRRLEFRKVNSFRSFRKQQATLNLNIKINCEESIKLSILAPHAMRQSWIVLFHWEQPPTQIDIVYTNFIIFYIFTTKPPKNSAAPLINTRVVQSQDGYIIVEYLIVCRKRRVDTSSAMTQNHTESIPRVDQCTTWTLYTRTCSFDSF